MIRTGKMLASFFGPWWAANNPLASAVSAVAQSEKPDWQPYLIATDAQGNTSYHTRIRHINMWL